MNPSIQGLYNALGGWETNPGSVLGGSGTTGLLPNDLTGYARMMTQQVQDANAARELSGQAPLSVRVKSGDQGATPSLADDPRWWASTNANVTATPKGDNIQYGGMGLPPSLAGLYKAGASTYKPNPPVSMPNSMVQ